MRSIETSTQCYDWEQGLRYVNPSMLLRGWGVQNIEVNFGLGWGLTLLLATHMDMIVSWTSHKQCSLRTFNVQSTVHSAVKTGRKSTVCGKKTQGLAKGNS